jgi:hypothetical protein
LSINHECRCGLLALIPKEAKKTKAINCPPQTMHVAANRAADLTVCTPSPSDNLQITDAAILLFSYRFGCAGTGADFPPASLARRLINSAE